MTGDSYDDIEPLLKELAIAVEKNDPRHEELREEAVSRCLPLAEHIARKFSGRGEPYEDLLQVARLGLVVSIDRFDVTRGSRFLSFAVPTIMGEVRRYFRDSTWAVRVPRRIKEIQLRLGVTIEKLAQPLGRMPTAGEIAAELGVDRAEVTQAMLAANAYQSSSLEAAMPDGGENAPLSLLDALGTDEPNYELVEQYLAVRPHMENLPEREREVLVLRFFEGRTQAQIADRLGVSQMHISRILSKTLSGLREAALKD
ncbi:RNA polymerase sigma factor SigF [Nocardia yunnanensis]|uniref:RNA polymerase sigma factor SigF n=1 Tax=Nocardia yunnanensis TaxID=2382165 RepID=A0A386ZE95_9NOCA|nr:RNA polymerase sigma factor SigF [Nocardia yunnanensis]AYF75850.1 RNA polymerase sigma factor SigF [Nocardia yunnanensis]